MSNTIKIYLSVISLLLAACGGGGVTVSTNRNAVSPHDSDAGNHSTNKKSNHGGPLSNGLTQHYQVPKKLVSKVARAKQKIFWEKEPSSPVDTLTWKTNGETTKYNVKSVVDFNKFPQGVSFATVITDYKENRDTAAEKIYNMPYSLFLHSTGVKEFDKLKNKYVSVDEYLVHDVYMMGLRTETLPTTGTATYTGVAFDQESRGKMQMSVDFGARSVVSGKLSGLKQGDIYFQRGEIKPVEFEDIYDHPNVVSMGFVGRATGVKSLKPNEVIEYKGQFFGPNAEEVNGMIKEFHARSPVIEGKVYAGFGGQRGEIKP